MSDPINKDSGPNPENYHSYAVGPLIEVASPTFAWFGDGSKSTSGAGINFGIGGRFEWDQHIFKVGYSHTNINLDGPLFLDKKSTSVESKGARFQYGYSFNRFFGFNIFFETGKLVYGQSSDPIAIGNRLTEEERTGLYVKMGSGPCIIQNVLCGLLTYFQGPPITLKGSEFTSDQSISGAHGLELLFLMDFSFALPPFYRGSS